MVGSPEYLDYADHGIVLINPLFIQLLNFKLCNKVTQTSWCRATTQRSPSTDLEKDNTFLSLCCK